MKRAMIGQARRILRPLLLRRSDRVLLRRSDRAARRSVARREAVIVAASDRACPRGRGSAERDPMASGGSFTAQPSGWPVLCSPPSDASRPPPFVTAPSSAPAEAEPDCPLVARPIAFEAIPRPTWDALLARTAGATPFSRWTVHRAWWDAYGATAHEQYLLVSADHDPADVRGIVPLMHR